MAMAIVMVTDMMHASRQYECMICEHVMHGMLDICAHFGGWGKMIQQVRLHPVTRLSIYAGRDDP